VSRIRIFNAPDAWHNAWDEAHFIAEGEGYEREFEEIVRELAARDGIGDVDGLAAWANERLARESGLI
jgi:hypothetical protein